MPGSSCNLPFEPPGHPVILVRNHIWNPGVPSSGRPIFNVSCHPDIQLYQGPRYHCRPPIQLSSHPIIQTHDHTGRPGTPVLRSSNDTMILSPRFIILLWFQAYCHTTILSSCPPFIQYSRNSFGGFRGGWDRPVK